MNYELYNLLCNIGIENFRGIFLRIQQRTLLKTEIERLFLRTSWRNGSASDSKSGG